MEYINFTNIGLILDIFGVLLLFFYGFPSKISRQKPTLVVRNYTDKENKNIIKHFLLSNITIVLIIIGFVLQLLGNFKASDVNHAITDTSLCFGEELNRLTIAKS